MHRIARGHSESSLCGPGGHLRRALPPCVRRRCVTVVMARQLQASYLCAVALVSATHSLMPQRFEWATDALNEGCEGTSEETGDRFVTALSVTWVNGMRHYSLPVHAGPTMMAMVIRPLKGEVEAAAAAATAPHPLSVQTPESGTLAGRETTEVKTPATVATPRRHSDSCPDDGSPECGQGAEASASVKNSPQSASSKNLDGSVSADGSVGACGSVQRDNTGNAMLVMVATTETNDEMTVADDPKKNDMQADLAAALQMSRQVEVLAELEIQRGEVGRLQMQLEEQQEELAHAKKELEEMVNLREQVRRLQTASKLERSQQQAQLDEMDSTHRRLLDALKREHEALAEDSLRKLALSEERLEHSQRQRTQEQQEMRVREDALREEVLRLQKLLSTQGQDSHANCLSHAENGGEALCTVTEPGVQGREEMQQHETSAAGSVDAAEQPANAGREDSGRDTLVALDAELEELARSRLGNSSACTSFQSCVNECAASDGLGGSRSVRLGLPSHDRLGESDTHAARVLHRLAPRCLLSTC